MAQIREIMTNQNIETLLPEATAQQAAEAMRRADTGSIPVMEGDQIIGMVTDRDLAIRGLAQGFGPECHVRDLMSADPICAYEDDNVQTIAQQMADAQVRRLPVLNRDDQLVGMVSLGDLSRDGRRDAADTALEGVSAATAQLQDA